MKTSLMLAALAVAMGTTSVNAQVKYAWQDTNLSRAERVENLLGMLTPDEKVGLMMNKSVSIDRLGIPSYNWWSEACHGVRQGDYTVYPQPIGMAAAFNAQLVYDVFRAYQNWYHDDTSLRDDPEELEWWYTTTSDKLDLQEWNFEIMKKMGEKTVVDFAGTVLGEMPLVEFINGDLTPAQLQEEYKQVVQDTLDQIFGA